MPLLGSKTGDPFVPQPPPANISDDCLVWYCPLTKEVFDNYQTFSDRMAQCQRRIWACAVTGKSGLTFAEAVKSEETVTQKLRSLNEKLEGPVFHLVSTFEGGNLDALVRHVCDQLKDRFFPGEVVDATLPDKPTRFKAEVIGAQPSPDQKYSGILPPAPCNYQIRRAGGADASPFVLSSTNMKHGKAFFSKDTIRLFIKARAKRLASKQWVIRGEDEVDAGQAVQDELVAREAKKQKRLEQDRAAREQKREEGRPRDDKDLTDSAVLPVGAALCLRLPAGSIANVIEFVNGFGKALRLDSADVDVSIAEFERELCGNSSQGRLCSIVLQLLAALLDPSNDDPGIEYLGLHSSKLPLDSNTVGEVLRRYIDKMAGSADPARAIAEKLKTENFFMLPPPDKLTVMLYLCDQALGCTWVGTQIDEVEEKFQKFKTDFAFKRSKVYTRRRDVRKAIADAKAERKSELAQKLKLEETSLQAELDAIDQQQTVAFAELDSQFRVLPLGEDRYQRRYWFMRSLHSLLIEPEVETINAMDVAPMEEDDGKDRADDGKDRADDGKDRADDDKKSDHSDTEELKKPVEPILDRWTVISTPEDVDALLLALNPKGLREGGLLAALKERAPAIRACLVDAQRRRPPRRQGKKAVVRPAATMDAGTVAVEQFKSLLIDLQERLCAGMLTSSSDPTGFTAEVASAAADVPALAALLLAAEAAIPRKFLKPAVDGDDKHKDFFLGEKERSDAPSRNTLLWRDAVTAAQNFSELFLCLYLLDGSVLWAKSALKTRCRLCHRAGEAEKMLLCDKCDDGYHMYCMTPKMHKVPEGEWFCHRCNPVVTPARKKRAVEVEEVEEESEAEAEAEAAPEVADEGCTVCGKDTNKAKILLCDQCNGGYHMSCLKPKLTSIPAGDWFCPKCAPATPAPSAPASSSRRGSKRSRTPEVVEEPAAEEEEEEEDDDDDEEAVEEEEEEEDRGGRGRGRGSRRVVDDDDDDGPRQKSKRALADDDDE
eukprot:m.38903 g.38903  ORF g.38903 m.38903 type:complete len:1000 (+) comp5537_c0_seq1:133-3132(+)